MRIMGMLLAPALGVLLNAAVPAYGAAQANGSWLAWYGCWTAAEEGVTSSGTLCVVPGEDSVSARFLTVENGAVTGETVIRADGVARPVEEGGCAGTQSAHFSGDGRRVFTRSDLTCANAARITTGILGFVAPNRWVDSQGLSVRDQHAARTIRYEAASTAGMPVEVMEALPGDQRLAREAARLDVSAPMAIAAVIEAAGEVAPPALEGFLAQAEQGVPVTASDLVLLDEHGVAPSTIDVLVALAYPERFAVRERPDEEYAAARPAAMRTAWIQDFCYDPFWSGLYNDCFNSLGYRAFGLFGYSPWGYDPYGWRYSRTPVFVIVEPEENDGGRVVRGRGYTAGSQGGTRPASRRDGGGESLSPSSRPRDSSGPSVSSGSSGPSQDRGYAPSGGSGSTRTAKPRDSE